MSTVRIPRKRTRPPRLYRPAWKQRLLFGSFAVIGTSAVALTPADRFDGLTFSAIGLNPACAIKGNISIESGERIYHVPGQRYYQETRITLMKGERWFCSEAEARRAGWRRSRI